MSLFSFVSLDYVIYFDVVKKFVIMLFWSCKYNILFYEINRLVWNLCTFDAFCLRFVFFKQLRCRYAPFSGHGMTNMWKKKTKNFKMTKKSWSLGDVELVGPS